jgi:hypothetical protein
VLLILAVPFGIAGIVALTQGTLGGIAGPLLAVGAIAFSVRTLQLRAVITPKEFVAHNYLRVRRVDISDVAAVDIEDFSIGDNTGWHAQERPKNGSRFWVYGLATSDVETVRQILHVGGETPPLIKSRRKGKEPSEG